MDYSTALKELAQTFYEFKNKATTLYAVGGCVRNTLLNIPVSDIDLCSAMLPYEVIALCEQKNYEYIPKGLEFGTVEVHIPYMGEILRVEHTTFRADGYREGGAHRPEVVRFSSSVDEDAVRRDFRVNAIYKNLLTDEIIDPTGGLADIESKLIRTTNDDPDLIMRDDGLRVMRMVRFASELGFDIDDATYAAACKNVKGLADVSAERIRDELTKILMSDIRYPIAHEESPVLRGLLLLRQMDAFGIIIPELELGRGVEQKRKYHIYDVQEHMLRTCAFTPAKLHMRLAGLLHDIGKPEAQRRNNGKNMHGHDRIGAEMARTVLINLRYPNELTNKVCRIIALHMYDIAGAAKENTLRMRFAQWGEEMVLDIIDFRTADIYGSGCKDKEDNSAVRFASVYEKMKQENAPFSVYHLNITGKEIMRELGISPCRRVGELKHELLRHCAIYPQDNNRERLLEILHDIANA